MTVVISRWAGAQDGTGDPSTAPAAGAVSSEQAEPEGSTADHSAGSGAGRHVDLFAFVLLELAIIVLVAMVGRSVAEKFGQPPVLGELLVGVVLGNVAYFLGVPLAMLVMQMSQAGPLLNEVWVSNISIGEAAGRVFSPEELQTGGGGSALVSLLTGPDGPVHVVQATGLWMFSNLGVILLLFMVGLETSVGQMLHVGVRAFLVAVIGVVVPTALAFGVGEVMIPDQGWTGHLFVAATLCATSVGITARVFRDLDTLHTDEARIIIGAAVIDDVLGLIVLAIVVGIVSTGAVDVGEIVKITLLSVGFIGIVIVLGERFVRVTARIMAWVERRHVRLLFPLMLAFVMAWLSSIIGLATIVGAFAAGLILDESKFDDDSNSHLAELTAPLERLFAPVFFVLMGMQVNLEAFAHRETLLLAAALTVVAIAGKIVAGVVAGPGRDRLSVGLGMVPRGEVGLIFASIGKQMGVVDPGVFSALVIMIIITTLVTPPFLKWSQNRWARNTPERNPSHS